MDDDINNSRFCFRKRKKVEYCEEDSSDKSINLGLSKKVSDSFLKYKSTSRESSHFSYSKKIKKPIDLKENFLTIKDQLESITFKSKINKEKDPNCSKNENSSKILEADIFGDDIGKLILKEITMKAEINSKNTKKSEYLIDCIFVNFPWEKNTFEDLVRKF